MFETIFINIRHLGSGVNGFLVNNCKIDCHEFLKLLSAQVSAKSPPVLNLTLSVLDYCSL